MKRAYTVLAVLLMAATTFSQDSRRTASTNSSARTTRTKAYQTSTPTRSNTKTDRVVVNSRSQQSKVNDNHSKSTTEANRNTHYQRSNQDYNSNRAYSNSNSRSTNSTTDDYRRPQKTVAVTTRTSNTRVESPRHSERNEHAKQYNHSYNTTRVYRGHHESSHVYHNAPYSRDYRAKHYVYREPTHVHVVWTRDMHRHYIHMYPSVRHWEYRYGYNIRSVSAYYADYYIGDVKTVYGKVNEVFYSPESDEYFLTMGAYYPYNDFTIVLPGEIARRFSARPVRYFTNEYLNVTGLITSFDGKPEIVVKRKFQLDVY